jgi:vitamin B12 transporter
VTPAYSTTSAFFSHLTVAARTVALTICATTLFPAAVRADEEMEVLRMLYRESDLVVTATRAPKPLSQVAENVSVITADEIEAINAHTLADVLQYVTGVQVERRGGPGSFATLSVQGSDPRHVRVMVDGVTLNDISANSAETGAFPVQSIERIEIVKGPASSSWGSSLGGVINIITRSPDPDRRFGGSAYASLGERGTTDLRAGLSGTSGAVGYHLSAGGISGDGIPPGTHFDGGNLYAKLQYEPTKEAQLQFTLGYTKWSRGDGRVPSFGVALGTGFEHLFSSASLRYELRDGLSLEVSGHAIRRHAVNFANDLAGGGEVIRRAFDDLNGGGSVKANWQGNHQNLLAGFDYDNGTVDSDNILDGRQGLETWALYVNDTLTWGNVSVTPGVRYDHTSTSGSFVSPSLGLTWQPVEGTVLRAAVARGFSAPPLSFAFGIGISNPRLREESVWSYSIGLESSLMDLAVLKATGFLHEIDDVITIDPAAGSLVNRGRQRRRGAELELRTTPVFHTSLQAGFAYIEADVPGAEITPPRSTVNIGIDYSDSRVGRGSLRGHYIRWNADPSFNGRFRAVIWDLNLARTIVERDSRNVELFFTAHNLFNGSQYTDSLFPNPRRWFEGGVRFRF